jgi:hypothetical protein
MPRDSHSIVERNFILKRVGEYLYLPCKNEITCKATPNLPNLPYLLCRTALFDEASGRLSLNFPSYQRWGRNDYELSVQVNSQDILDFNVKEFEILSEFSGAAFIPYHHKPEDLISAAEWKPITQEIEAASPDVNDHRSNPSAPHRTSINAKWLIPIQEMRFGNGKISFTRFIYPILGSVDFEITNSAIIMEYDAIKEYFEKILGSKFIECQVRLVAVGKDIQLKSAEFCKGDIINGSLVEKVQDFVVAAEFLNEEEGIAVLNDKLARVGKVLGAKEPEDLNWLLDRLEKLKKSKHYHHLRYLASRQEVAAFRLRITGKPISFIFVIKGTRDHYLVWETYETEEATYIWKLASPDERGQAGEVKALLDTIAWLRASNKIRYIRSKASNFWRIEHDYGEKDWGIEKWKTILTELTGGDNSG